MISHNGIPNPVFIYASQHTMVELSWVFTRQTFSNDEAPAEVNPARLWGYKLLKVRGTDRPVLVMQHPDSYVDGFFIRPQSTTQQQKLDEFAGDSCNMDAEIVLLHQNGPEEYVGGKRVYIETHVFQTPAEIYVWGGDTETLLDEEWTMGTLDSRCLNDWYYYGLLPPQPSHNVARQNQQDPWANESPVRENYETEPQQPDNRAIFAILHSVYRIDSGYEMYQQLASDQEQLYPSWGASMELERTTPEASSVHHELGRMII